MHAQQIVGIPKRAARSSSSLSMGFVALSSLALAFKTLTDGGPAQPQVPPEVSSEVPFVLLAMALLSALEVLRPDGFRLTLTDDALEYGTPAGTVRIAFAQVSGVRSTRGWDATGPETSLETRLENRFENGLEIVLDLIGHERCPLDLSRFRNHDTLLAGLLRRVQQARPDAVISGDLEPSLRSGLSDAPRQPEAFELNLFGPAGFEVDLLEPEDRTANTRRPSR
jgi:hypothetical protein